MCVHDDVAELLRDGFAFTGAQHDDAWAGLISLPLLLTRLPVQRNLRNED